jgi:hypothetical protein
MAHVFIRRFTVAAVLVIAGALGLPVGQAAVANDATAAWSVSPANTSGVADGRTRFELKADPGTSIQDHVVISNASTVERTFAVYGADAFNTESGGYDLKPAATAPVDVGTWARVDTPTVTIPALKSAVVLVTIAVPAGASPGDHPGGIAVSVANPAPSAQGVVIDTRVAVRLNVRVSGQLTPALGVRSVQASYGSTWVPFGGAATVVSYQVVNTGNVKIIGKPRIRVTGPFGIRLKQVAAANTQEILPGQSFTVQSVLAGVAPIGVATAVVDVDMSAAPGPDTQIPLVSSTERTTFLAASWTGLLIVALLALAAWFVVRRARQRRRDGEALWREMLVVAAAGASSGSEVAAGPAIPGHQSRNGGATRAVLAIAAGLVVSAGLIGASLQAASAAAAAELPGSAPTSVAGTIQLSVPTGSAPPAGMGGSGSVTRGMGSAAQTGTVPGGTDSTTAPAGAVPTPSPSATQGSPPAPDLVWAVGNHRLTPTQWGLVGVGGTSGAWLFAMLIRTALPGLRRWRGIAS